MWIIQESKLICFIKKESKVFKQTEEGGLEVYGEQTIYVNFWLVV